MESVSISMALYDNVEPITVTIVPPEKKDGKIIAQVINHRADAKVIANLFYRFLPSGTYDLIIEEMMRKNVEFISHVVEELLNEEKK